MRRLTVTQILTWVTIFLIIAVLALVGWWAARTITQQREANLRKDQEIADLLDSYTQLYSEAQKSGADITSPEPQDVGEATLAGPQGLQGVPGPQGPPGEDGTDGLAGAPGVPGTNGSDGRDGEDGAQGATGETGETGPQGPSGADGATGPAGPAGATGPAGKDGRGIEKVECRPDGMWYVTYTDGTTSTAGACLSFAVPTP